MKYRSFLPALLAALLLLSGCGGTGSTGTSGLAPSSAASLPAETGAPVETGAPETSLPETVPPATEVPTEAPTEPPAPAEALLGDVEELLRLPASPYAEHVYSHRGTGTEEWSETFAAYDLAIAYGSRYIEQDIRVSADGVLYCSSAATPEELTGETRPFSELNAAEIDALRTSLDGQAIPRLSAVFARYGTAVHYLVEIQPEAATLEALLELVREYGMEDNVILQCSDLEILERAETEFPEMPKLFLCFRQELFEDALAAEYVDIVGVSGKLVTAENCERAHEAGKQFNVYVVNRISSIRTVIELGADSYFTDYTAKAFVLEALYRDGD